MQATFLGNSLSRKLPSAVVRPVMGFNVVPPLLMP
jgi:hypothetical protein